MIALARDDDQPGVAVAVVVRYDRPQSVWIWRAVVLAPRLVFFGSILLELACTFATSVHDWRFTITKIGAIPLFFAGPSIYRGLMTLRARAIERKLEEGIDRAGPMLRDAAAKLARSLQQNDS